MLAYTDAGYTGVEKREEHKKSEVIWQIAARRSTYSKLNKRGLIYKAKLKIEYLKAQARAKVEHPFRVIKRQFDYVKVRFRGLMKNTAQLTTLFALSCQRNRLQWSRYGRLADLYIPRPRNAHPYPEDRFRVTYPRQEPYAVVLHVRI